MCGWGRLQMKGRRFLGSCLCVSAFDFSLALSLANQEETAAAPSRRTWCAGHKSFLHTHLVQIHVSHQSWGLQAKWCFPLIPFPGACRVCPTACTGRELEGPVAGGVLLKSPAGLWEGSPELSWGIQLSRTLCREPGPGHLYLHLHPDVKLNLPWGEPAQRLLGTLLCPFRQPFTFWLTLLLPKSSHSCIT